MQDLTQEERHRYGRQLNLPQVGTEGQLKLKRGRVLVVGAGGLGSPVLLYLSAAGVGTIGIVDDDTVDVTNLQRQVMYGTADAGRLKAAAAAEKILSINPLIHVDTYRMRLTGGSAQEIIKNYDVVIDATDNYPSRYLINDACVLLGKPYVYGSVYQCEGQVCVFDAAQGACYRCLYSSPPDAMTSSGEGGVLGILPGIVGSIQAAETIKLLLGNGSTLTGRLLTIDAWEMKFRELRLQKNPACPVCGEQSRAGAEISRTSIG